MVSSLCLLSLGSWFWTLAGKFVIVEVSTRYLVTVIRADERISLIRKIGFASFILSVLKILSGVFCSKHHFHGFVLTLLECHHVYYYTLAQGGNHKDLIIFIMDTVTLAEFMADKGFVCNGENTYALGNMSRGGTLNLDPMNNGCVIVSYTNGVVCWCLHKWCTV